MATVAALGTSFAFEGEVLGQQTSSSLAALLASAQHPAGEHELADGCVRILQHMPSKPHDMRWDY
jgi:hypothetical protein